jgi:hypothetical protein
MATNISKKKGTDGPSQTAGSQSEQPAEIFQLEPAKAQVQQVKWSQIIARPQEYAFRAEGDKDPFSKAALGSLKESIKRHGSVHTALLLKAYPDGTFLLGDGNRRYFSLGQLIEEKVQGFTAEMLLPANVLEHETSDLVMISTALSANIERQPLGFQGRLDATLKLHGLGMPKKSIAQLLNVSDSTVDRDLILANDAEMRGHILYHCITASNAATLLAAADKAGRTKEFKESLRKWLSEENERRHAEQKAREERDEPPLSGSKLWLQNAMTSEMVSAWRRALEKGTRLRDPGFKFRAYLREEGGHARIEIGSLSKPVSELSSGDVAKVVRRCLDLAAELEPVLLAKATAEKQGAKPEAKSEKPSPGLQRLRELGLASLVGEKDEPEKDAGEPGADPGDQADPDEANADKQGDGSDDAEQEADVPAEANVSTEQPVGSQADVPVQQAKQERDSQA